MRDVWNERTPLTHPPSAAYMRRWIGSALVLNQCWVIVNWTLRNKLQWKFNQNILFFIPENASENIVRERAPILSRGRWVDLGVLLATIINTDDAGDHIITMCKKSLECGKPLHRKSLLPLLSWIRLRALVSWVYLTHLPLNIMAAV